MAITALRSRAFSQQVIAAADSRSSSGRSTKAAVSRMRATTTSCTVTPKQTTRPMPRCREPQRDLAPSSPPFSLPYTTRRPAQARSKWHASAFTEHSQSAYTGAVVYNGAHFRGVKSAGSQGAALAGRSRGRPWSLFSSYPMSLAIAVGNRSGAPRSPSLLTARGLTATYVYRCIDKGTHEYRPGPGCRGEIRPVPPSRPGRSCQWESMELMGALGGVTKGALRKSAVAAHERNIISCSA